MNRRDFLKGASAAIVPAALPGALWTPARPAPSAGAAARVAQPVAPITAVVFDERYPDCRVFAETLSRRGAKAFATNQDAVQLWYGPLGGYLAQHFGRVAGLTTYADFSVSKACGRELNLAPIHEGEHDGRRSRAELAHRLRTVADDSEFAAAFGGVSWAAGLAEALDRLPTPPVGAPARLVTATTPRSEGHPGYLNSWLLS